MSTLLEASYSRLLASEAESGGALLGCGGWTFGAPDTGQVIAGEAHIRHFATHPDWGRRGIGTSLLDRCVSDARSAGVRKIHCVSTLNAEPFYLAAGFETVGPINVPMGPTLKFPGVLMMCEFT
ncbi:MAG: GNAT family N-acetyltransferase [Steroidobacteraceae bacterium]